ncbi:helix-turn-helix domain-containing protein [Acidisoma sp. 7E03]
MIPTVETTLAVARPPVFARRTPTVETSAEGRGCATSSQLTPLLPWQIRKLSRFIEDNLHGNMPVQAMAETVRLSRSHFSRIFAKSLGCTPRAYLQQRRLQRARVMMGEGCLPLADIALLCGFADQSHLCRSFRRAFGEPPSHWRRRQPQTAAAQPA